MFICVLKFYTPNGHLCVLFSTEHRLPCFTQTCAGQSRCCKSSLDSGWLSCWEKKTTAWLARGRNFYSSFVPRIFFLIYNTNRWKFIKMKPKVWLHSTPIILECSITLCNKRNNKLAYLSSKRTIYWGEKTTKLWL